MSRVEYRGALGESSRRGAENPARAGRGRVRSPRKLLAQSYVPSEDRCAMKQSARSQNYARVFITAVLFAAFSWTLLVSVSPQLHGCIHRDANRGDHVCAITLIASGSYEHGTQPPVITPPQFDVRF